MSSLCLFSFYKLAGFLTAADRREMEIKDVIVVLKNDQSKIRPQVQMF